MYAIRYTSKKVDPEGESLWWFSLENGKECGWTRDSQAEEGPRHVSPLIDVCKCPFACDGYRIKRHTSNAEKGKGWFDRNSLERNMLVMIGKKVKTGGVIRPTR